jgi:hypothetical protein
VVSEIALEGEEGSAHSRLCCNHGCGLRNAVFP